LRRHGSKRQSANFLANFMKAMVIEKTGAIESNPLKSVELPRPGTGSKEILIKVETCGICHTDLHIAEGDIKEGKLSLIPGHQVVGIVHETGKGVRKFKKGDRAGVPWLYSSCGSCKFCLAKRENLCENARFTGYHVDGGYAEFMSVHEDFAYPIPEIFSDAEAAPLLCAGVIGYRSFRLSSVKPGERFGLYGFGASAHIVIQIAVHLDCEVYVFSRSSLHRKHAEHLGAKWTGMPGDSSPHPLDSAIIFAPAGDLVPIALKNIEKGGTLALAGIHMSPVPEMDYSLLYHERILRSVANSTRRDVEELLKIASEIPVKTSVEIFGLEDANIALKNLKTGRINGAGVLRIIG